MAGELSNLGFALIGAETNAITQGTGGAADTVGAVPTNLSIVPRIDLPGLNFGRNNAKDYAIGTRGAQSNNRGYVNPTASVNGRLCSMNIVSYALPASDIDSPLTQFCLLVGVSGLWTVALRYCKWNTLNLNFQTGQAITFSGQIMALAAYFLATPITINSAQKAALRAITPYFWHDKRTLTLGGTDISRYTESMTVGVNNNLTPRLQRSNWGATNPLSRTPQYYAEGAFTCNGNLVFARDVPSQFTDATACADVLGDLVGSFRNQPCANEAATGIDFTLSNCLMSNEELQGVAPGAPVNFTLPFGADYMSYALV